MKRYAKKVKDGFFEPITDDMFAQARNRIVAGRRQGIHLLSILYYTGCRPNEALRMTPECFGKEGLWITVRIPSSKGGFTRQIFLPATNRYIMEAFEYSHTQPPHMLLFWHFCGRYVRYATLKDGTVRKRLEISDNLRHHIHKWFDGILPPESNTTYMLRHNCFSKMASKGASLEQIRIAKGGRSINSVLAYVHLIKTDAKKIGKLMG